MLTSVPRRGALRAVAGEVLSHEAVSHNLDRKIVTEFYVPLDQVIRGVVGFVLRDAGGEGDTRITFSFSLLP